MVDPDGSDDRIDIDALLQPYQRFGVHLGLERIQRLLARLGQPQQQIPFIHVAGTNGKGSVCAYLSAALVAAGYRVGRYTSPHLQDWTERIAIDDRPIARRDLVAALKQTIAAIDPDFEPPTLFEVVTAAAWAAFARQ
ncbi:MAG: bifunctional folylpolyglutamate synthase/dihydrofolate synthase, partial [Cyanobacteria bacterium J06641_5]